VYFDISIEAISAAEITAFVQEQFPCFFNDDQADIPLIHFVKASENPHMAIAAGILNADDIF
jgi:hypothetical protein